MAKNNGDAYLGYGNLGSNFVPDYGQALYGDKNKKKSKKEKLAEANMMANMFEYNFNSDNVNQLLPGMGNTSDQSMGRANSKPPRDAFINDVMSGGYAAYANYDTLASVGNQIFQNGKVKQRVGSKDKPIKFAGATYGDYGDSLGPNMNPNILSPLAKQNKQVALRAINQSRKQTLGTLAQMSPVFAEVGGQKVMIQGKNFANPEFKMTNPKKTLPTNSITYQFLSPYGIPMTYTASIPGLRDAAGKLTPKGITDVITKLKETSPTGDYTSAQFVAALTGKDEKDIAATKASLEAASKARERARNQAFTQQWTTGEGAQYISQANAIRAQLGLMPLTVASWGRPYKSSSTGKTSTKFNTAILATSYNKSGYANYGNVDPIAIINEYNTKKAYVDFGKQYGLTLEPTDARSFRIGTKQGSSTRTWVSSNATRRKTITDYFDVPVYSPVMMPQNEAQTIEVLYDKLVKQAKEKQARYEAVFEKSIDADLKQELASVTSELNAIDANIARRPRDKLGYGSPPRAYLEENAKRAELAEKQRVLQQKINYSYMNYFPITEEELSGAETYRGDLEKSSSLLADDVQLLQEAIAKLQIQTGKGVPDARKSLFAYENIGSLESNLASARNPFDLTATSLTSTLGGLGSELNERQTRYNLKESFRERLEKYGLVKANSPVKLDSLSKPVTSKIENLNKSIETFTSQFVKVPDPVYETYYWTSNARTGARTSGQRETRASSDARIAAEQTNRNLQNKINSAKGQISELNSIIQTINQYAGDTSMFEGGMIGQTYIADLNNRTIESRGSRARGSPKTGSIKIKVPENAVKDGKVVLEANLFFDPRYGGFSEADLTGFGKILGNSNTTRRALFDVDSSGYVTINTRNIGSRNYDTVALSNIQVYQPANNPLYNEITNVQNTIKTRQAELAQTNAQRDIYTQAQSFLTGQSSAFTASGKKVAEVTGGKFQLYDPEQFTKYFGSTSPDVFTSSAIISPQVRQLSSKISNLSANEQSDAVKREVANLEATKQFITGKSPSLSIAQESGDPIVVARRTQTGTIQVKDKTNWDKLGLDIPEQFKFTDPTISYKIESLESEIENRQSQINQLLADIRPLATEQVTRTSAATLAHYKGLKNAGLISLGDYKRAVKAIESGRKEELALITDDKYIPTIDTLDSDAKSDAEQITEESKQIIKDLKRQQAAGQAYGGGTTKPKTPAGSVVGAVMRVGSLGRGAGPSGLGSR